MDHAQDLFDAFCRKLRVRHQSTVLGLDITPLDAARAGSSGRIHRTCVSGAGFRDERNRAAPTPVVVNRRRRRIELDQADEARDRRVVDFLRSGVNP